MARLTPLQLDEKLRAFGLGYPETTEDFPWGERALKVRGKAFTFMRADAEMLSFSVKLPVSAEAVADLPFAEPTHYGLGKHGWVTIKIDRRTAAPPLKMLQSWIDESYRAVAPKKLVATLDAK